MNGLTRENNNEEKEDGTKKRNKRLFIVAIVSTVVWSVVFGIFFILKFISGQSSTKWDLFLNGWSMLLGLPVHCWAMYVKNSSFIEKIGNYLWKLFFDRAISTKEVQPYYEEIGNRIIVAQRGEKFYDAIYKNRTDMFDNKKLYQESGTSITYISPSGGNLAQEQEVEEIMEELKNKNITIYVLDMKGDCAQKRDAELANYQLCDTIKNTVFSFKNAIASLPQGEYKNFKLYKYDDIPYLSGVIFEKHHDDIEYYVTHHLFYTKTKDCISFKITQLNKSYTIYKDMFNQFIQKNSKDDNLVLDNRPVFQDDPYYNNRILEEWGIIDKKVE